MRTYVAVANEHFSEHVRGPDGAPIDLVDTALPRSADTPSAARLLNAIAEAKREMRVRLGSTPAGREAEEDRARVLRALRDLERDVLSS